MKNVSALLDMTKSASETDIPELEKEYTHLQKAWEVIETQLYLGGEYDHENCYVTIASGAGGTEAQDWAEMLLRMYLRFCERKNWNVAILERNEGQEAGIKSATFYVQGSPAYGELKCEQGTHRLVRLSPFNAKNLRQTSFALVEVLPELPESTEVDIDPQDLRIDTFRSSGAGGQHVNTTDSAVRITHIPTGLSTSCQNERSQQQNRIRAMSMLRGKLQQEEEQERKKERKALKGEERTADFGQQIRSYVLHPYKMVKDLRTDVEINDPELVLDGELQEFIDAELRRRAKSSI